MLKCNVGKTERVIRLLAGLVLIGVGIVWRPWPAVPGILLVGTALLAWCPISTLLGVSTCRDEEEIPPDTTEPRSGRPQQDRRFK